ncbi:uncharacterized protein LOC110833956 [Zootermopsis nevadensis]|uniref:Uncharacterized protein n=1 Tax=Zootermopsis nevadensis TaxID=136037 RepID=A0A067R990_ZOONE|nr:uncharacterized protein LOC110833956 [Zootermopsis nevadensis]KDR15046.1 hypothetical protein L798_10949 [Zootermopsis nevadensis]
MIKVSCSVLVVIICLTAAYPANEMSAAVDKCQKSQGVSDLESILNEGSMTLKDESNEVGRCFIQCLMTEFGILKGDNLDADTVIAQAQDLVQYVKSQGKEVDINKIKSSITDCGNKDGDGKCMKTYKSWTCLSDMARSVAEQKIN